ncbi:MULTISPECIES: hypothetical protein [unclassified Streptomyces]|uniref:hypothetical protein n=1 Tax=unclassified Streptomyces TaxID=2593676 RepID=UPI0033B0FB91
MQESVVVGVRGRVPHVALEESRDPRAGAGGSALPWLAGVAAALTLAHLVLVARGLGLGWDETVYVSQVGGHAPAAYFSAPRARGISYLVAPVTAVTGSVAALRLYLAVLAGCGLFLALWVWRRLLPAPVLALAGALFASLWITLFYAGQAMPNLWVAYGALAATGCFLRAARDPGDRWAVGGMVTAVAFAGMMRPADAVWLVLALAAAAVVTRAWRWPLLLVALAVGLALGWAEWVVEAYARYGGLMARLKRASEIQGGLGWYLTVDDHARALGGRTLCRPCDVPWRHPAAALWFFALPLLVAGGVAAAARARLHRTELAVAGAVGVALALPYLFTVGYAAPRFLLPAYALLALPVARCLLWLCRSRGCLVDQAGSASGVWCRTSQGGGGSHWGGGTPVSAGLRGPLATDDNAAWGHPQAKLWGSGARRREPGKIGKALPGPRRERRRAVAALLAVALLAHLAVQYLILDGVADRVRRDTRDLTRIAAALHAQGVRPPCVVSGEDAIRVAYRTGCASRQPGGHDGSITPAGLTALSRHHPVAVLVSGTARPPAYARDWREHRLPDLGRLTRYRAYVAGPAEVKPMEASRTEPVSSVRTS